MAEIGVKFYIEAVQNPVKTAEAGRPIYDETEMVEVLIPGDKNFRPVFPAHELAEQPKEPGDEGKTWAEKYREAYQAFRDGNSRLSSGTPLEEAAFLSRAKVSELRALGITSVEQLASLSDRNRQRLGPEAMTLTEQARAYIAAASDAAAPVALAAENMALRERMQAMEDEMRRLMTAEAPAKRGPGRPRKADAEDEEAA